MASTKTPMKFFLQLSRQGNIKGQHNFVRCYNYTSRLQKKPNNSKNLSLSLPPPELKIDLKKGHTILEHKAKRAAELNAELNALLEDQSKRRAEEMNRPFGSGFIDFVRKSQSQLINIFAAFTCVVLASQLVNFRKSARKLLEEANDRDEKINELKGILRTLSSNDFALKVENEYNREQDKHNLNTISRPLLSLKEKFRNKVQRNDTDKLLHHTVQNQIRNIIGSAALTDSEAEERKMLRLQENFEVREQQETTTGKRNVFDKDSSLGGLEQLMGEVEKVDVDSPNIVVKNRKGFI